MKFSVKNILIIFICLYPAYGQEEKVTSPEDCARCHKQIYNQWKGSQHAKSYLGADPLYTAMYNLAQQETDGKLKKTCMNCHMPFAVAEGSEYQKNNQNQGVSCKYCHSIAGLVKTREHKEFLLDHSNTRYGPHPDADDTFHDISESDIHKKSDICLVCHAQFSNMDGVPICTTGEEYLLSSASENEISCKDCHMPVTVGKMAAISKQKKQLASHAFPGAHDSEYIAGTLDLNISAINQGKIKKLNVEISNSLAAHGYPTGTVLRMVILKIQAKDAEHNVIWNNWVDNPLVEDKKAVFMKAFADENGNAPVFPWRAKSVAWDTRLKPDETRILTYDIPEQSKKVKGTLILRLAPPKILKKLNISDPHFNKPHLITKKAVDI